MLGHLLTRSRFTRLEVSLIVTPCYSCLLVCSCLVLVVILFICCNQFLIYSRILHKTQVIFSSFAVCLFYNLSKCILLLFSLISSLLLLFFLLLLLEWSNFHYRITEVEGLVFCIDRFALGSSPYGPDSPRPYRWAPCAP